MRTRDTSKQASDMVTQLYRNMSPAKKWTLIGNAMQMGQQLAMAGLRQLHPNANKDEIWHLWAKQHLGEELYQAAYGDSR